MNSKSIYLIIFLTSISILPKVSNAQTKLKLGLRAGMNYVNNVVVENNWERLDEREFRFGYHFGICSKFYLSKNFSTSLEINYSNQGYHSPAYEAQVNSYKYSTSEYNINYNYLSIPLFIEYSPVAKLTFQIGPQIGYMLSAENKTETIDLIEFWETNRLDFNRFDFGIGLGSEFNVTDKLLIGLRYFHGFSSLFDHDYILTDDQGNPLKSPSIKEQNRNLQISIAYVWSLP